jgi:hypothetical protein
VFSEQHTHRRFRFGTRSVPVLTARKNTFSSRITSHDTMRQSIALRSLIKAPSSRPEPTPAPAGIREIFSKAKQEAAARGLSLWPWLAILTATTITINSPESMLALFQYTTCVKPLSNSVAVAEFMREVRLRCVSINGIHNNAVMAIAAANKHHRSRAASTCSMRFAHRFPQALQSCSTPDRRATYTLPTST